VAVDKESRANAKAMKLEHRGSADDAEKGNTKCNGCPLPKCGAGHYGDKIEFTGKIAGGTPALLISPGTDQRR
jgi:hypothetical protein